jgi:hypothetical protein
VIVTTLVESAISVFPNTFEVVRIKILTSGPKRSIVFSPICCLIDALLQTLARVSTESPSITHSRWQILMMMLPVQSLKEKTLKLMFNL